MPMLDDLGIAIGIELDTVADLLPADFDGMLYNLPGIGYTDVKLPNFGERSAAH